MQITTGGWSSRRATKTTTCQVLTVAARSLDVSGGKPASRMAWRCLAARFSYGQDLEEGLMRAKMCSWKPSTCGSWWHRRRAFVFLRHPMPIKLHTATKASSMLCCVDNASHFSRLSEYNHSCCYNGNVTHWNAYIYYELNDKINLCGGDNVFIYIDKHLHFCLQTSMLNAFCVWLQKNWL